MSKTQINNDKESRAARRLRYYFWEIAVETEQAEAAHSRDTAAHQSEDEGTENPSATIQPTAFRGAALRASRGSSTSSHRRRWLSSIPMMDNSDERSHCTEKTSRSTRSNVSDCSTQTCRTVTIGEALEDLGSKWELPSVELTTL